ncbi:transcriptional repressor [Vagococcus penaei]|uniref:Transcriptional repressor n=1 Tax=Vagococcus penaei TaxID=633807 RepID=A0A1Q2D3M2_9ENTE|nr:Fur family transcriptional regulator [Vagococcus penaei]AQP52943.1 transcriptional repressor [Vagococcus penaei]RSU02599.1 transcriptional repressor [Vagococcus penaei]
MQHKIDLAMQLMKDQGFKYTKRRVDILTFLAEEDRYVGALEVFEWMNQQYQGMSYDTVYRNLRDFSQLGILEETELNGEKKYRFHCDTCAHQHHHHHFICTECGATRELNLCPMDFFKEQLPGCIIESHRFEILGKCDKCAKK